MRKKRLGVVVNPVAGMGGRVGLKGTDGLRMVGKARKLGASPESPRRTVDALQVVSRIKDELEVFAYPREMGEYEAVESGLSCTVLGSLARGESTPEDTLRAVDAMRRARVDLMLFTGGDGTARDVHRAGAGGLTVLGIPAGVKMHSAVFAKTPRGAGEAAVEFLSSKRPDVTEGEVMDIDEDSFRRGVVAAKLFGYLRIPAERRFLQGAKSGAAPSGKQAVRGIAGELMSGMDDDTVYIFGPGTTTRDILSELGLRKTLLGVDVLRARRLIATDANERQLAALTEGRRAKIVTTAIGGQGYIFGRGNQQISAEIIRRVGKENIVVVATKEKLASLEGRPLLVDTGDASTDRLLNGFVRVITGLNDYVVYKVGE